MSVPKYLSAIPICLQLFVVAFTVQWQICIEATETLAHRAWSICGLALCKVNVPPFLLESKRIAWNLWHYFLFVGCEMFYKLGSVWTVLKSSGLSHS